MSFTITTDEENGKLRALDVTSVDGTPCPQPPKREKREKKPVVVEGAAASADGETADGKDDGDGAEGPVAGDQKDGEGGGDGKKPRRRKRGSKKKGGGSGDGDGGDGEKSHGNGDNNTKPKTETWEKSLEESVQTSMTDRGIQVDRQGRAFLTVGDARIKLGTDEYAALAHAQGLLAEGSWSVEPNGKVALSWKKVLKHQTGGGDDGASWVPSTAADEKDLLVTEIDLTDGE